MLVDLVGVRIGHPHEVGHRVSGFSDNLVEVHSGKLDVLLAAESVDRLSGHKVRRRRETNLHDLQLSPQLVVIRKLLQPFPTTLNLSILLDLVLLETLDLLRRLGTFRLEQFFLYVEGTNQPRRFCFEVGDLRFEGRNSGIRQSNERLGANTLAIDWKKGYSPNSTLTSRSYRLDFGSQLLVPPLNFCDSTVCPFEILRDEIGFCQTRDSLLICVRCPNYSMSNSPRVE